MYAHLPRLSADRRRYRRDLVAAATATAAGLAFVTLPATPSAAADGPVTDPAVAAPPLTADISPGQLGWLRLQVAGTAGDTITVQEDLAAGPGVQIARFVLEGPTSGRAHLTPWMCDKRARHFTVSAEGSGAETQTIPISVTTPSCADRVQLRVATRRPTAQRPLTLVARDRWATGPLPLRLCVQGPAEAASRCRSADLTASAPSRSLQVAPPQGGLYRIEVRGPQDVLVRRTVLVAPRSGGLRLLATGDSEIQILDSQIADRLRARGVRVTSDAHVGSGISKLFQLNWLQHAATFARTVHPDVTVVFLGANDGYAVGSVACCDRAWSRAYAVRAQQMMRSYVRGGAGRVYWFLLPTPRPAAYAKVFTAVNRGLRRAAARVAGVRLIDLGPSVTPGGRFHPTVSYHGQTVAVREPDGIHLSVAGDRIALDLLVDAMHADGAV